MTQNDNFYLAEAFNRLSLLNEDAFDLSADKGVVDELQSFVADDIEAPYEEEVIDIEADNERELQDSYVGKVILQCDCCHAKIYKDPNEVILDETGELANVGEECPVCNCEQGWKVIGKIEPYEEPAEEEEKVEVEDEVEFSDDEISEALRESLNEAGELNNYPIGAKDLRGQNITVADYIKNHFEELPDDVVIYDDYNSSMTFKKWFADHRNEVVDFVKIESNGDGARVAFYIEGTSPEMSLFDESLNPDDQAKLDEIVDEKLTDAAYEAEVNDLDVHKSDMEKAEASFNDDFFFGDVDESCKNEGCKDCKEECDKDLEEKCEEDYDDSTPKIVNIKDNIVQYGYADGDGPFESEITIKDGKKVFKDEDGYEWSVEECDRYIKEKCDESLNEALKVGSQITLLDDGSDWLIKKITKGKPGYGRTYWLEPVNRTAKNYYNGADFESFDENGNLPMTRWDMGEYVSKEDFIKTSADDLRAKNSPKNVKKALKRMANKDESLTEEVEVNINDETAAEDAVKIEDSEQEPIKEKLEEVQSEDAEKLVDPEKEPVLDESLNEDVRNVSIDVDGETHVEIEPKEDGGVEIEVNPSEEAPVEGEGEMIAPLDDQDIEAIEGNNGELPEEEPVEDEFEIDDFDEESFDELGESFLKRVYDNVGSFNTTKVTQDKGKLVVEGLIKFNSGKEKATSFVFENYRNTKRGKTMISGMNETFSKSNKAFLLKGVLENKKYTCESLTYNYNVQQLNESNKSETIHVYGRAIKR